ncbi:MAG TPA: hypothetical protein VN181_00025, partial [Thermoanaerobaculia bacterium]|nr:hypothetical protein [Thermoanaerobaculia bacterium]
ARPTAAALHFFAAGRTLHRKYVGDVPPMFEGSDSMNDSWNGAPTGPPVCFPKKLYVDTYAELLEQESEMLRRIETVPDGGNLFLIHPFMLLADIGVELSDGALAEILEVAPHLRALSDVPYRALRASGSPQRFRVHLRGLFNRRTS